MSDASNETTEKPQPEAEDAPTTKSRRRGLVRGSARSGSGRPDSARPGAAKPGAAGSGTDALRRRLASLVWLVAVICALFLAIGALVKALDMNLDNPILAFINTGAHKLDFGQFKDFGNGKNADVEGVLVNWGIAAIIYLAIGKILDRLIRP